MTNATKYRLLTRSDFDGLVCAMLLNDLGILGEIQFVHPKDIQDGKIPIGGQDVLANLPYVAGCQLCFDHHASEVLRSEDLNDPRHVLDPTAESAARVIYNYFGGQKKFPRIATDILDAVDKADSARFTREEILNPTGWVLLAFVMDPRTGLGRFRNFRVSNYQLMMDLIQYCKDHSVEEILRLPDVAERVRLFNSHRSAFEDQLRRCSTVHGDLVVIDLRNEDPIFSGNRFVIYALYPECNISMHIIWGKDKINTVFTVGKSILNRSSHVRVGDLMLEFGGGGHDAAGTCQVAHTDAERVQWELIRRMGTNSVAAALTANPA